MASKLPSKAGDKISKKQAQELVDSFAKKFKTKNKSTFYTRDVFDRLLSLPGCVGVRVYAGEENNTFTPVLVGVDANGENIFFDAVSYKAVAETDAALSAIEERGATCPPYCPGNDL